MRAGDPPPPRRAGGGAAAEAGPEGQAAPRVPSAGGTPAADRGPRNQFNVAGDSLYVEGGRFGEFTGIRKDRPYRDGSEGAK